MNPIFDFYEVVRVVPNDVVPDGLWETLGVVVGRSDRGPLGWEYAVQLVCDDNQCWQLPEGALRSEGRKVLKEDLYEQDPIRVVVDPYTGVGSVKK